MSSPLVSAGSTNIVYQQANPRQSTTDSILGSTCLEIQRSLPLRHRWAGITTTFWFNSGAVSGNRGDEAAVFAWT
jgi:hypothetical protein